MAGAGSGDRRRRTHDQRGREVIDRPEGLRARVALREALRCVEARIDGRHDAIAGQRGERGRVHFVDDRARTHDDQRHGWRGWAGRVQRRRGGVQVVGGQRREA